MASTNNNQLTEELMRRPVPQFVLDHTPPLDEILPTTSQNLLLNEDITPFARTFIFLSFLSGTDIKYLCIATLVHAIEITQRPCCCLTSIEELVNLADLHNKQTIRVIFDRLNKIASNFNTADQTNRTIIYSSIALTRLVATCPSEVTMDTIFDFFAGLSYIFRGDYSYPLKTLQDIFAKGEIK